MNLELQQHKKKDMETIKNNQPEMKDTLNEMNNLQGLTVEWMKLRIKSATWNIRKKKESPKMSIV